MNPKKRLKKFNQILRDIKSIKIQGATNIAKSALYAYSLFGTKKAKQELIKARPTEPLLFNILKMADKLENKQILKHLEFSQEKINKAASKLIKNNAVIFTYCHSSTVIKALIYAKKQKKKFQVYNTETRPLYQGRKTARELRRAGIRTTIFVDAATGIALGEKQNTKKVNAIFLGADAILKDGVINKVGSGMISDLAKLHKIPVYILSDSWKFAKKIKLEERDFKEVWKKAPKKIKIKNPAFEKINKKLIKAIISELGILSYSEFLKKVNKRN